MSTLDDFPYDFLTAFTVGGIICTILCLSARRLIRRSIGWRAFYCILVAATITPICFPFIFGKWIVAPAILITLALFDGTNPQFGLLFGLLPILTIAALIFASWSVVTSRNITKNQPPNGF